MKAITTLMQEHQLILQVLSGFEYCINSSDTETIKERLPEYVRFIREFADKIHHGKEEDILFEEMGKNGFPVGSGPISVMLHEHQLGRASAAKLSEKCEKSEWNEEDLKEVSDTGSEYIALLRQHIYKEDNILYPLAQNSLSTESQTLINGSVESFQSDRSNADKKCELTAIAEKLMKHDS